MRKKRLTRKQRIMRKRITIAACIAVVIVVIIVAVVLLLNANRKKSTDTNDNTIVTTSDSSNNTESKAGDSINYLITAQIQRVNLMLQMLIVQMIRAQRASRQMIKKGHQQEMA